MTLLPCFFLLALIVAGDARSEDVPQSEPTGLRAAIAKHENQKRERSRKNYHANLPDVDPAQLVFSYGLVDLNGDGVDDAIVYLHGEDDCGSGGCTVEIYRGTESGFQYVSGSVRIGLPIQVLPVASHGWKTLVVALREGGNGLMPFDGKRYPLAPPDRRRAKPEEVKGAITIIRK